MNAIINYIDNLKHTEDEQGMLPHIYGHKWYDWAWKFYTSTNPYNFLCSGNQVSKSSTMIRKCITLATAPDLWPEIWKRHTPTQFWYFYPSKDVCTTEFDQKWIKEFLPRDEMKSHPIYGWKEERAQYKKIYALHFNSGITVYFHSYEQRDTVLQASSVFAVFCDEELPEEMFDELNMRMSAVDGLFHMAFTATLGLRFWYDTMEIKGKGERFKGALKIQVSKWDCLKYRDGTPSFWTPEKIRREERACRTEDERLKRIDGRFVLGTDSLFPAFKERGHSIKTSQLNNGKPLYFSSVYLSDHTGKAGIIIISVKDDFTNGEIIDCYQYDDGSISSINVYNKFTELSKNIHFAGCFANPEARDFITISRIKDPYFYEVRKPSDNAEKLINSLFSAGALKIIKGKNSKELIYQIRMSHKNDEKLLNKELLAAFVLVVVNINWNFTNMLGLLLKAKEKPQMSDRMKYWLGLDRPEAFGDELEKDFQALNQDIEGELESYPVGDDFYG